MLLLMSEQIALNQSSTDVKTYMDVLLEGIKEEHKFLPKFLHKVVKTAENVSSRRHLYTSKLQHDIHRTHGKHTHKRKQKTTNAEKVEQLENWQALEMKMLHQYKSDSTVCDADEDGPEVFSKNGVDFCVKHRLKFINKYAEDLALKQLHKKEMEERKHNRIIAEGNRKARGIMIQCCKALVQLFDYLGVEVDRGDFQAVLALLWETNLTVNSIVDFDETFDGFYESFCSKTMAEVEGDEFLLFGGGNIVARWSKYHGLLSTLFHLNLYSDELSYVVFEMRGEKVFIIKDVQGFHSKQKDNTTLLMSGYFYPRRRLLSCDVYMDVLPKPSLLNGITLQEWHNLHHKYYVPKTKDQTMLDKFVQFLASQNYGMFTTNTSYRRRPSPISVTILPPSVAELTASTTTAPPSVNLVTTPINLEPVLDVQDLKIDDDVDFGPLNEKSERKFDDVKPMTAQQKRQRVREIHYNRSHKSKRDVVGQQKGLHNRKLDIVDEHENVEYTEQMPYTIEGETTTVYAYNLILHIMENVGGKLLIESPPLSILHMLITMQRNEDVVICYDKNLQFYDPLVNDMGVCGCRGGIHCVQHNECRNVVSFHGAAFGIINKNTFYCGPDYKNPQGRGVLANWKVVDDSKVMSLRVQYPAGDFEIPYSKCLLTNMNQNRFCVYANFGSEFVIRMVPKDDVLSRTEGLLRAVETKGNEIVTIFPIAPTTRHANYVVYDTLLANRTVYETMTQVLVGTKDIEHMVVIPKTLVVDLAKLAAYSIRDRTLMLSLKSSCIRNATSHGVSAEDLDMVVIYAVKLAMYKNIAHESLSVVELTELKNDTPNVLFEKTHDMPVVDALKNYNLGKSLFMADWTVIKQTFLALQWFVNIMWILCSDVVGASRGMLTWQLVCKNFYDNVKIFMTSGMEDEAQYASLSILYEQGSFMGYLYMALKYRVYPSAFWINVMAMANTIMDAYYPRFTVCVFAPIIEEIFKEVHGHWVFAWYEATYKRGKGASYFTLFSPIMVHLSMRWMDTDFIMRVIIHMAYNTFIMLGKDHAERQHGMPNSLATLLFKDFFSQESPPVDMEKVKKNAKISHPLLQPGFERLFETDRKLIGRQIGPVYVTPPAVVCNDITSLLGGIIRQAECGTVDDKEFKQFSHYFKDVFVPYVCSMLGVVTPMSEEEFLAFQPADKRRQYVLAKRQCEIDNPVDLSEWEEFRISTFTKVEWTVPEFDKCHQLLKKPRIISNWHKYMGLKSGPFFVPLSKRMNAVFNSSHNLFYCSATTPIEVGNYIAESCNFIDNDCSKWDGHVAKCMKELELFMWKSLGMDAECVYYYQQLMDFDTKIMLSDVNDKYGMRIRIPGTRYSGSPETSVGNSLLNMSLHLYALGKYFKTSLATTVESVKMVVLGDDINIGVSYAVTAELCNHIENVIKNLGHIPKVENRVLHTVEFCSQHVHPVEEGYSLLPKLGKLLQRSSWHRIPSVFVSDEERIGRYVADLEGRKWIFSQMPFVRKVYENVMHKYKRVKRVYDVWQQPYVVYMPHKITFNDDTNSSIMYKYGLNMSDVASLEEDLDTNIDHNSIHPVLQAIVDQDNGFEGDPASVIFHRSRQCLRKDRADKHYHYAMLKTNAPSGVRKLFLAILILFFLTIILSDGVYMPKKYHKRKGVSYTWEKKVSERGPPPVVPKMPLDLDDDKRISIKGRTKKARVSRYRGRRTRRVKFNPGETALEDMKLVDSNVATNSKRCAAAQLQPWFCMKAGIQCPHPLEVTEAPYWRHSTTTKFSYNYGTSLGGFYWGNLSITKNPGALIEYATSFNIDGSASAYLTIPDVGYSTYGTIFETMTVVAQEVRIRQIGVMGTLAGESVLGWTIYKSRNMSYASAKTINTRFTHSDNIPGDICRLQAMFVTDQLPDADNTTMDYIYCEPGLVCDQNSSIIYWSASSGVQPQSVDVEVITHYASRPFAGLTNIYYPTPAPVETGLVAATETQMLSRQPNFDIARCVIKDDGIIESIIKDVRGIVGGVNAIVSGVRGIYSTVSNALSKSFCSLHPMEKLHRMLKCHSEAEFNELVDIFDSCARSGKDFESLYQEWKANETWKHLTTTNPLGQHIKALEKQLQDMVHKRVLVVDEKEDDDTNSVTSVSSLGLRKKR